jgi:metal-responsive CopG/Arc/MetJ family transcriptional regulator
LSTKPVTISLDEKTLKTLDEIRGLIKRSSFIQEIIIKNLEKRESRGDDSTQLITKKTSHQRSFNS